MFGEEPAARHGPPRALVRDLFLRLLGLLFLGAFLSLLTQITLLVGERGLLPAGAYLRSVGRFWQAPSIFWFDASDGSLRAAAVAGAGLSLGLVFNVAPRLCLLACWVLYLSFANVGQDFLSFQWDNLLLETAFFSLFVTPGGFRPRHPPAPHSLAVFLMLWLVFRLHVESAAAKLLLGDPTWRDLTAMVTYYETAPLPTWIGWHVHQLPGWAHRLCAAYTYLVELVVPFLLLGPRLLRAVAFVLMAAMQVSIIATANYGYFNYLSLALVLWVLDDSHLAPVARMIGRPLTARERRPPAPGRALALATAIVVLVPLTLVPFLPFVRDLGALNQDVEPVRRALAPWRSINAYHLFARMTFVRREAILEGSRDGVQWEAYEFRYKPGDPLRRPPFVAPHQPRVDFQLWFLLLGRGTPSYFTTLLARLQHDPTVVAPLFARTPFPDTPPAFVRVAVYRYRFTDAATRTATGAWWRRDLEHTSVPVGARGP